MLSRSTGSAAGLLHVPSTAAPKDPNPPTPSGFSAALSGSDVWIPFRCTHILPRAKHTPSSLYVDPPQNVHTTWDLGFASWAFGLRPHMGPM